MIKSKNAKRRTLINNSVALLFSLILLIPLGCVEDSLIEQPNLNTEQRHWTFNDFNEQITNCEAQNLTYYIPDCLDGTGYLEGIQSSMQAYNDAPLNLHWTEVINAEDADLIFSCIEGGECGEAQASTPLDLEGLYPNIFPSGTLITNVQTTFPSGGSIGGEIVLFTEWEDDCECEESEMDLCFFRSIIMHEVAHVLGFTHNDVEFQFTNNQLVHQVEGTPLDADPTSILNSGAYLNANDEWCDAPCHFNANDIIALQTYYPKLEIEGPNILCLGETGRFCLTNQPFDNFDVQYNWGIDMVSIIPSSPMGKMRNCIEFSSLSPGEHHISVTVYESGCSYTISRTVFVHELEDCDDCHCACEYILENNHNEIINHEQEISCDNTCVPVESYIGNYWVEESELVMDCD